MKKLFIILIGFILIGCKPAIRPVPLYPEGSIVYSVVSGQRGQVLGVSCLTIEDFCTYTVRFSGTEALPTLLVYWMKEYELEAR